MSNLPDFELTMSKGIMLFRAPNGGMVIRTVDGANFGPTIGAFSDEFDLMDALSLSLGVTKVEEQAIDPARVVV